MSSDGSAIVRLAKHKAHHAERDGYFADGRLFQPPPKAAKSCPKAAGQTVQKLPDKQ